MELVVWGFNGLMFIILSLLMIGYKSKEKELKALQDDIKLNKAASDTAMEKLLTRVESMEIETHKIRTNYVGKFGEVRLEIRDSIGELEQSISTKFESVNSGINNLSNLLAQMGNNNNNAKS